MNYSTVDRFQGSYLGSIIASYFVASVSDQNWLATRKTLADQIIQAPALNTVDIAELLCTLLSNHDSVPDYHGLNSQGSGNIQRLPRSNLPSFNLQNINPQNNDPENIDNYHSDSSLSGCLSEHHHHLLTLLPLTMFLSDNPWQYNQIIAQYKSKSALTFAEQEDILIWSRLLSLSLNHQFELSPINPSVIIKQVLTTVPVQSSALGKRLELVMRGWEQGWGLHQLSEQLFSQENSPIILQQIAIALSCYCFASTPQDFQLAVRRATKLEPNIAWLTTTLTGTLSGAYNGMTGISWSWRAIANQQQSYQQAQQQSLDLFKTWLGVLSIDNQDYDQELQAAAPTNLIQSRKALEIISQQPYQPYQS